MRSTRPIAVDDGRHPFIHMRSAVSEKVIVEFVQSSKRVQFCAFKPHRQISEDPSK
jgi:hypothetical protein